MLLIQLTLMKDSTLCSSQEHGLIQSFSTPVPPNAHTPSALGWEGRCRFDRGFRREAHGIPLPLLELSEQEEE